MLAQSASAHDEYGFTLEEVEDLAGAGGEHLAAYCIGHNLDGSHFYTKAQQEQHKERHNRCHNYIR